MSWITLPIPESVAVDETRRLLAAAASAQRKSVPEPSGAWESAAAAAAASVVADLRRQGWAVRIGQGGDDIQVRPPSKANSADLEKKRVQTQEALKRNEQLRKPSVRRFIKKMESPREVDGEFRSVFSLMRDGVELSQSLAALGSADFDGSARKEVIDPYVQIVDKDAVDGHTGLRLMDIWRYFRHTWANQYTTVPGRTMLVLVRDRAVEPNAVIGIAALSSSIVQLDERDSWIGWRPNDVLEAIAADPSLRYAKWLVDRLETRRSEIYVDDLVRDGVFWPGAWANPSLDQIESLRVEALARREDHQRLGRRAALDRLDRIDPDFWAQRARTDLYRSRRCQLLADLLRDKARLLGFLYPKADKAGLRRALEDKEACRAITAIARRAKADSVGTEIADLSVCGAVAPYGEIIGGKLVAMLCMSPTIVREYHAKYRHYESEIASSIAGRPISRRSKLVFIGTTSLYGTTSSQYNRIRIPSEVISGSGDLRLERLGRSRSFGTSHLSTTTVKALVELSEQSRNGARVNSLFGEGVNPKLRKVRAGLDELGWPSNQLLQHGRQRLIYGVSLVDNLNAYLLGMHRRPQYRAATSSRSDVDRISCWWSDRWLSKRIKSDEVLERIATHTLSRPVCHGARVTLPDCGVA